MNAITNIDLDSLRGSCPAIFATEAHASRSADYTFIPTIDAIRALAAEGFTVASAKQSRSKDPSRRAYTKHMIRLRAPGIGSYDLFPEVVLINAHDGNARYKAMGGAFRHVCSNGMIVSDGIIEQVAISHRGDVIANVIEGVQKVMSHARDLGKVCDHWRGVELTYGQKINFVERAMSLRYEKDEHGNLNTSLDPQALLTVRRDADLGDNLWHVFNRVQENMINGGLSYTNTRGRSVRNMRTRAVRNIADDVKINQGLWALASEFAGT